MTRRSPISSDAAPQGLRPRSVRRPLAAVALLLSLPQLVTAQDGPSADELAKQIAVYEQVFAETPIQGQLFVNSPQKLQHLVSFNRAPLKRDPLETSA